MKNIYSIRKQYYLARKRASMRLDKSVCTYVVSCFYLNMFSSTGDWIEPGAFPGDAGFRFSMTDYRLVLQGYTSETDIPECTAGIEILIAGKTR